MLRILPSPRWAFAVVRMLALAGMLILTARAMHAQCPTPDDNPDYDPNAVPVIPETIDDEEPVLPEAGFLTDTHYTNQFFGFAFDLPLTVKGHEIMMPVMPPKEHALLALQFEEGERKGYMIVSAIDPKPGFEINTPEQLQEKFKSWARTGSGFATQPIEPIPDFLLHSGHFFYSVRHKGHDYAAQYWTAVNNYVVKVVIATNDQPFLRKAKADMADAHFYCPQDDGTLIDKEGKGVKVEGAPYEGPTVPTYRVNAALHDEPGKTIPLGEVKDGVYHNAEIGMQYQLPKGWAVLPAEPADPPQDDGALREYKFLHACSQTLLRIAPQPADGARPQPLGPMIVLRALDPNCLSMRTALSLRDKRIIDEVAASLEETKEFGQIDTDELISLYNHMFMVFHGTIATTMRGEDLGQRMSQSIFATRYNKLLLVWSLMAPTSAALEQIPTSGILFDGSPPIELHTTLRAGK